MNAELGPHCITEESFEQLVLDYQMPLKRLCYIDQNNNITDYYFLSLEDEFSSHVAYDITNELNPIWKFLFSFQNYQMETDRNTIYKIHISAYNATIEFSDSWNYRNDSHSWESLMLRY